MLLPSLASPPCARATKAAHRRRPAVAALPRATRRKTGPRRPDRDDLGHDFARAGPLALASERHWQVSDGNGPWPFSRRERQWYLYFIMYMYVSCHVGGLSYSTGEI